jgi:hypothetical protein
MKRIHTLVFGVGIVAALGFGSASAFAEPNAAPPWAACPFYADEDLCVSCCEGRFGKNGYDYHDWNPDTGECRCYF